ncbi:unnamed protein product, partial [Tetraodon nigroviridis]
TKLELQKHSATLDNEEQASVFEVVMRASPKSDKEENELVMASLRTLYEKKQSSHQHSVTQKEEICEKAAPTALETHHSSSQPKLGQLKSRAKRSLTESLEGIWKGGSRARAQTNLGLRSGSSASIDTVSSSQEQPCLDDPLPAPNGPLRPRCSTGDPKRLDSPSALAPPTHSLPRQGDAEPQGMRRRANTFSHSPIPPSAEYSLGYTPKTQKAATSASSKLIRHYSVSSDTPHQSNSFDVEESPLRSHGHSWRQQIFLRVATPQKSAENMEGRQAHFSPVGFGGSKESVPERKINRSKDELRELWRTAIKQQILLQRMEKENLKLK